MQTEVSIGKLRVDFNLNILLEDIQMNDLYGNNLISAKKGSVSFPTFNTEDADVEIRNIVLEEPDVILRKYESDTALNIQFFIDFVRPKEKTSSIIDLPLLTLKHGRFQFRNDNTAKEDKNGVWNYSNMIIEDIDLKLDRLLIVGDSLNFHIRALSARERSGFEVEHLDGHLIVAKSGLQCLGANIITKNKSELNLDFRIYHTAYSDYSDFIRKVSFDTDVQKGNFNMEDLQYFVPSFKGMRNRIYFSASAKGPIVDFKIKNLNLRYGRDTKIEGDIALNGLPKIEDTFIDFDIRNLKTNVIDLSTFILPQNVNISLPDIAPKINWVQVRGHFLGLYDNFFADASFATGAGNASCELMFNHRSKPVSYDGKLQVHNLELGRLIDFQDLEKVSLQAQVKGEGVTVDDMNMSLQTTLSAVTYRGNTVENIHVSGDFLSRQFEGKVSCNDEDLDFDFAGLIDLNQKEPYYDFEATFNAVDLSSFKLFHPDSNVVVSAFVDINIAGKDVEHFQGEVVMKDIVYRENNIEYPFPDFVLHAKQHEYPSKDITLFSEVLSIDLAGKFTYLQAYKSVQENVHAQLSNMISPPEADITQEIFPQQFNLMVHLKKSIPLLRHFVPQLDITKGITASLSIDQHKNTSNLSVSVPQLIVEGKMRLDKVLIDNQQSPRMLDLDVACDAFYASIKDTLPTIQSFNLQADVSDNVVEYLITAMGNQKNMLQDVLLEGSVHFVDMDRLKMEFVLNNGSIVWENQTFLFDTSNYVYYSKDSIFVRNFGLQAEGGKSIVVHSGTTDRGDDAILFAFKEIDLGLFNIFLDRFQIQLNGIANGNGALVPNASGMALGSRLTVDNFHFNNVEMGFLEGHTIWNNIQQKLLIHASLFRERNKHISLLTIGGNFDPKRRYIDLTGDIDSLNIKFLEPYLSSFASKVEGIAGGQLTFKGNLSNAKLEGQATLKHGILGVDFLKTEYFIDEGNVKFVNTGFVFENIHFRDAYNGNGTVDGIITHDRLRNFGLNLRLTANNLSVLKTHAKDNNLFYGTAFGTGNATIYGKVSDAITISAEVTTNPMTDITLSLDWSITATESNFISFVAPESTKTDAAISDKIRSSGLLLNLRINATPDALVRVVLDPSIGGTIVGRGAAAMELILDANNDFSLFGNYTIASGEFNLAWGDIFTRIFKLQNGGVISFNGDPMQGTIHAQAVLAGKVSIPVDPAETTVRRRPYSVNNILRLSGQLIRPDFSFTFELPDADEFTKSFIYSNIDTSNREEMVRQMVNVLLLGMFETQNETSTSSTLNTGLTYSLSEIVSYQMNRFVTNLVPNINVRGNYRPGDELTESEYSMDVSGTFFNDKLTISTSFGIIERQDMESQDRVLGDFMADYKLTQDGSLRLKAFNVTNQQDILQSAASTSANYSQGMGLSYSKDFDKFSELFKRNPNRRKKPKPKRPK
ncbi:MAG: translocation/assembly module TamB [Bacteroidales bacterium]|jgi:hypothetical protein|nr:translocation/assembly module TamB [Bacteroidales bacterium]